MSTPAQTQILDAIAARLALIATANGYATTAGKIERARLGPFRSGDLPAINYWPGEDVRSAAGAGWEERQVTVFLEYYERTRDRPFSDVAAELAGDVWVALWRSAAAPAVSDSPTQALGGLVSAMVLERVTPALGEGQAPYCAALLEVVITYRRKPSTPHTILT